MTADTERHRPGDDGVAAVATTTVPITATTRVAAVVGSPVRHSLSPVIHQAAFAAAGLDMTFVAFEVAPGEGADAVRAARTLGLVGLAVTTPHKEDVARAVDEVDAAAAALGSVNTVVVRDDGTTFGASTDGDGFIDSMHAAGHDPGGRRIAIVGAGAAARSVVDALHRARAAEIVVINRTPAAAERAAALSDRARAGGASPDELRAADIVVNATSVGMGAAEVSDHGEPASHTPFDPAWLRPDQVVADLVYHPLETPLLAAARAVGCAVVDGLGMLVHQAARQQLLWTGRRPDPGVLRAAAAAALADRG